MEDGGVRSGKPSGGGVDRLRYSPYRVIDRDVRLKACLTECIARRIQQYAVGGTSFFVSGKVRESPPR